MFHTYCHVKYEILRKVFIFRWACIIRRRRKWESRVDSFLFFTKQGRESEIRTTAAIKCVTQPYHAIILKCSSLTTASKINQYIRRYPSLIFYSPSGEARDKGVYLSHKLSWPGSHSQRQRWPLPFLLKTSVILWRNNDDSAFDIIITIITFAPTESIPL